MAKSFLSTIGTNTEPCIYYSPCSHTRVLYTVKPPKKGRIGDGPFVPSREVVLFQRFSLLRVNIAKYAIQQQLDNQLRACSRQGRCGHGGVAKLSAFGGKF